MNNSHKIVSIIAYKKWGDNYAEHLYDTGVKYISLAYKKQPQKNFESKIDVVLNEIHASLKSLFFLKTFYNNIIFCQGRHYALLLIFKIFGKFLGRSHLFLYNYYLHGLGNILFIKKILSLLLNNPKVTMIVQSHGEIEYFRKINNTIDIKFVPYCSDFNPPTPPKREGYIFSGGYSNRDYSLLLEASKYFPTTNFVLVTSKLNGEFNNIPPNVLIYKDLPKDSFENLLSNSSVVIIPLKENVGSSGQMLCISAMRNAKTIIYSDIPAINYYFNENNSIPYKIGNLESLVSAINKVVQDELAAIHLGENALKDSEKFRMKTFYEQIDKILIDNT